MKVIIDDEIFWINEPCACAKIILLNMVEEFQIIFGTGKIKHLGVININPSDNKEVNNHAIHTTRGQKKV